MFILFFFGPCGISYGQKEKKETRTLKKKPIQSLNVSLSQTKLIKCESLLIKNEQTVKLIVLSSGHSWHRKLRPHRYGNKKKVLKASTMDQAEKPDIHLFKSHNYKLQSSSVK